MEAVPRLPMLKVDLKLLQDSSGADWIDNSPDESLQEIIKEEINTHIRQSYSDDPKKYKDCVGNFLELQSAAHRVLNAPDMEGCNTLKKYYGQLHFMQSRFSFVGDDALNVPFAWSDAFTEKYTQHSSFVFEQSAILFNLGAIHSYLGSLDTRVSEEGTKISCVHFQCAAGFFQYMADHIDTTLSSDSTQFMLKLYINTMLGQGQECLLEKSMQDNRKNSLIAKIAQQVVDYYERSLNSLNQSEAKQAMSDANKIWQRLLTFKVAFYSAIVKYYLGSDDWDQEKYGSGLSYFGASINSYNESVKLAKNLKGDIRTKVDEALTYSADVFNGRHASAKKDNEFIYHEKVPDPATLPDIKGASLVKALPFDPSNSSVSGPDLFSKLVPLEAHLTASTYSEEKAKLLRPILAEVEEKDVVLEQYKQAIELDPTKLIKLDDEDRLNPLLVEHCAALSVDQTPIQELTKAIKELSDVYMDIDSIILEAVSLIEGEENDAKQVEEVCGKTIESVDEIEKLRKELEICKDVHEKAGQMNDDLHTAMKVHISNLKVVSEGLDKLKNECNFASVSELITDEDIEDISTMEKLCSKVAEMETQRQSLVTQLRSQLEEDDVTSALMTNPGIDAEDLFKEQLKKHDTLIGYIKQNLAAQDNILNAVTEANVHYAKIKKVVDGHKKKTQSKCDNFLLSCTDYTAAVKRCDEGTQFFKELHDKVKDVNTKVVKLNEKNSKLRKIIVDKHEVKKPPPRPTAPKPKTHSNPTPGTSLFSAEELAQMATEDMDEFNDPAFLNYLRMSGGLPSGMPASSPRGNLSLSRTGPPPTPHGALPTARGASGYNPQMHQTDLSSNYSTPNAHPHNMASPPPRNPSHPGYNSYMSQVPRPQATTLGQKPIMSSQQLPPSNNPQQLPPSNNPQQLPPSSNPQQLPPSNNPTNYQQYHSVSTPQSGQHAPNPGYSAANSQYQMQQTSQPSHNTSQNQQSIPANQTNSYSPQQPSPGYQHNQTHQSQYQNQQLPHRPPAQHSAPQHYSPPSPRQPSYSHTAPGASQRFPPTSNHAIQPMSQNPPYQNHPQYSQPHQAQTNQPSFTSSANHQNYSPTTPQRGPPPGHSTAQPVPPTPYGNAPNAAHQPAHPMPTSPHPARHTPPTSNFHGHPSGQLTSQANLYAASSPAYHQQMQPTNQLVRPQQPTNQLVRPQQPTNQLVRPQQPTNQIVLPQQPTNQIVRPQQPTNQIVQPQQPNNQIVRPQQPTNQIVRPQQPTNQIVRPQQPTNQIVPPQQPTNQIVRPQQPTNQIVRPQQPSPANQAQRPQQPLPQQHFSQSQSGPQTSRYPPASSMQGTSYSYPSNQQFSGPQNYQNPVNVQSPQQHRLPQQRHQLPQQQQPLQYHQQQPHRNATQPVASRQSAVQHPGAYAQNIQTPVKPHPNQQLPTSQPQYHPYGNSAANAQPVANQQRPNYPQQYSQQPPQNWQSANLNRPAIPQMAAQQNFQPANQSSVLRSATPSQPHPNYHENMQQSSFPPQPALNQPKNAKPVQTPQNPPQTMTTPLNPTVTAAQKTPPPDPLKPSADLVGLTYTPTTEILLPTRTNTSADELLTNSTESNANDVQETKTLLLPTKVDTDEMVVTRIDGLPYKDEADLMKFKNDTEAFQRKISTLLIKQQGSLCQLDKDWKQLSELQEKSARQQSTAVGRCSTYKNRFQDILPFDQNRIVVTETKDDYINASLVDDINKYCPRFIATQSPLPSSCGEFWTMVHEQQVTVIVMLVRNNEIPKKCAKYWPEDRNVAAKYGPLSITFTRSRSHGSYEERTFTLKHAKSSLPRSLIQLQYTAWPEHGHPSSFHDLLSFMDVVDNYHSQQRSLQWPIIVHCENGVNHTGTFCSAYACIKHIDAGLGIPDVLNVIEKMRSKRKNMVQEKTQLKFVHDLVNIRATELLKQRGVIIDNPSSSNQSSNKSISSPTVGKNAFDVFDSGAGLASIRASVEKLTVKNQSSNPELTSASSVSSIPSQADPSPVDINALIGNNVIDLVQGTITTQPSSESIGSIQPDVISNCQVAQPNTNLTDVKLSTSNSSKPLPTSTPNQAQNSPDFVANPSTVTLSDSTLYYTAQSASSNFYTAQPSSSNSFILDQLTPESFTLGTEVKEKKRISKADFFKSKTDSAPSSNGNDPFASLDPLWGFKK